MASFMELRFEREVWKGEVDTQYTLNLTLVTSTCSGCYFLGRFMSSGHKLTAITITYRAICCPWLKERWIDPGGDQMLEFWCLIEDDTNLEITYRTILTNRCFFRSKQIHDLIVAGKTIDLYKNSQQTRSYIWFTTNRWQKRGFGVMKGALEDNRGPEFRF